MSSSLNAAQASLEEPSVDSLDPPLSSWLEDLHREDDTSSIYTYTSTWSTNYTMSNLAGPGRLLGNLYSRAGSSLERRIGKLAYRAGLGSHAKAEELLQGSGKIISLMMSKDKKEWEKACNILVRYANSNNTDIQLMAFEKILHHFSSYPLRFRAAFENFFLKRKEQADAVTFSWKRPGTEYTSVWLHNYKLVSCCLSMPSNPFMSAAAQFDLEDQFDMSFSELEEMFLTCEDMSDSLLAISIVPNYWNGQGAKGYAREKGFDDPVLLKFSIALVVQCEVVYSLFLPPSQRSSQFLSPPPWPVIVFVEAVWKSLRVLDLEKLDEIAEDDSQFLVWAEIFKLHYIAHATFFNDDDNAKKKIFDLIPKTWKELCEERVPGPKDSNFRVKLLPLEDIHGNATRKRFSVVRDYRREAI